MHPLCRRQSTRPPSAIQPNRAADDSNQHIPCWASCTKRALPTRRGQSCVLSSSRLTTAGIGSGRTRSPWSPRKTWAFVRARCGRSTSFSFFFRPRAGLPLLLPLPLGSQIGRVLISQGAIADSSPSTRREEAHLFRRCSSLLAPPIHRGAALQEVEVVDLDSSQRSSSDCLYITLAPTLRYLRLYLPWQRQTLIVSVP